MPGQGRAGCTSLTGERREGRARVRAGAGALSSRRGTRCALSLPPPLLLSLCTSPATDDDLLGAQLQLNLVTPVTHIRHLKEQPHHVVVSCMDGCVPLSLPLGLLLGAVRSEADLLAPPSSTSPSQLPRRLRPALSLCPLLSTIARLSCTARRRRLTLDAVARAQGPRQHVHGRPRVRRLEGRVGRCRCVSVPAQSAQLSARGATI